MGFAYLDGTHPGHSRRRASNRRSQRRFRSDLHAHLPAPDGRSLENFSRSSWAGSSMATWRPSSSPRPLAMTTAGPPSPTTNRSSRSPGPSPVVKKSSSQKIAMRRLLAWLLPPLSVFAADPVTLHWFGDLAPAAPVGVIWGVPWLQGTAQRHCASPPRAARASASRRGSSPTGPTAPSNRPDTPSSTSKTSPSARSPQGNGTSAKASRQPSSTHSTPTKSPTRSSSYSTPPDPTALRAARKSGTSPCANP